jgi:uncharacterized protein YllA (UPF0747 family)
LITEIDNHPERFSPNVVLRPLFQEFILPNLTYVGGAGELSYWLQYNDYFKSMNVSFPLLSLRNHFMLIDTGVAKRMEDLKLLPEDLFNSTDELIREHIFEISDADVSIDVELETLQKLYSQLKSKAIEIDGALVASVDAEHKKLLKAMQQWGSRFTRSLKKKNEVSVNRIEKLHQKLFPYANLQERHDNFLEFYSNTSRDLIEQVYEATDPFSTDFKAIRLD